jgi:hypothetical protein
MPSEGTEVVAPLVGGGEEADRHVVDRERVRLKRPGRVLGADQARLAVQDAGLPCQASATLGGVPEAARDALGSVYVAGEPGLAEPGQELLRPALAAVGEVDGPHLGGGEDAVLGERGDHLDSRLRARRSEGGEVGHAPSSVGAQSGAGRAAPSSPAGADPSSAPGLRLSSSSLARMRSSSVSRWAIASPTRIRAAASPAGVLP